MLNRFLIDYALGLRLSTHPAPINVGSLSFFRRAGFFTCFIVTLCQYSTLDTSSNLTGHLRSLQCLYQQHLSAAAAAGVWFSPRYIFRAADFRTWCELLRLNDGCF